MKLINSTSLRSFVFLKTIGLGIVLFFFLLFLSFHLYLFFFFENTPYTSIEPVVENFKLCKICNLVKRIKRFQTTLFESYTIKTNDGIKLTDKLNAVLSKLSTIEHNNCGKHICVDNISEEEKKADCTAIDTKDMNELNQILTEVKNDIIALKLTDQSTYTDKINKIITLLSKFENTTAAAAK